MQRGGVVPVHADTSAHIVIIRTPNARSTWPAQRSNGSRCVRIGTCALVRAHRYVRSGCARLAGGDGSVREPGLAAHDDLISLKTGLGGELGAVKLGVEPAALQ